MGNITPPPPPQKKAPTRFHKAHLTSCVNPVFSVGEDVGESPSGAFRDCSQDSDILVFLFKTAFVLSEGPCCCCVLVVDLDLTVFRCVFQVDLLSYVTRFQWDRAKYPTTKPLSCLKDLIHKVSSQGQAVLLLLQVPLHVSSNGEFRS